METVEPSNTDDTSDGDPFQDLPKIRTIAVNQGFMPEALLFWRRRKKPAPA